MWSAQEGYPGDPVYRDFYRDIGFDLPIDYIEPYIHPEGIRIFTGIKYHAITHRSLHDKRPYDPHLAYERAAEHAGNFMFNREKQVEHLRAQHEPAADRRRALRRGALRALVVRGADVPRALLPQAPVRPGRRRADHAERLPARVPDQPGGDAVAVVVGREGLRRLLVQRDATPGSTGTCTRSAERMVELARRFPRRASGCKRRALDQAAREVMLAQSSDWAFIMKTGTTVPYATKRTIDHVKRFTRIYDGLMTGRRGRGVRGFLSEAEKRDNLFPDMDYRVYGS